MSHKVGQIIARGERRWLCPRLHVTRPRNAQAHLTCAPAFADLIFTTARGGPINEEYLVKKHFKPVLRETGLPNIRLYDLRHTAATLAMTLGVSHKWCHSNWAHKCGVHTGCLFTRASPHAR
jgi:integrase